MWKFQLLCQIFVAALIVDLAASQGHTVCGSRKLKDSHPLYCDQYYLCLPSAPYLKTCPGDTLYDEKLQNCFSPTRTSCARGKKSSKEIQGAVYGACQRVVCGYPVVNIQTHLIDPNMCSHLHVEDLGYLGGSGVYLRHDHEQYVEGLVEMKKIHPDLKLMIIFHQTSMRYETLAKEREKLYIFLGSAAQLVREIQFDGLVISWTQPHFKNYLYSEIIKQTMTFLQQEATSTNMSRLILSHHVGGRSYLSHNHYDIAAIYPYIDYTVIVTSNMAGPWHGHTGHHSNLDEVTETIDIWIARGHPKDKLVVGITMHGRSFKLKDVEKNEIGSPSIGHGQIRLEEFTLSYTPGYPSICKFLNTGIPTVVRSPSAAAPYVFHNDYWLGYEDLDSVFYKTMYIIDRGLGGVYMQTLDKDDVTGEYCGQGVFSLVNAALAACRL